MGSRPPHHAKSNSTRTNISKSDQNRKRTVTVQTRPAEDQVDAQGVDNIDIIDDLENFADIDDVDIIDDTNRGRKANVSTIV